jgi:hypothetical protein
MWVEAKMKCDEVKDNMMKHNQFFNLLSFLLKTKQGVYFMWPIFMEVDTDTVWLEVKPTTILVYYSTLQHYRHANLLDNSHTYL